MAQFDEGSVWPFGPPSLNQAQQVPLTAMVHFQSRSYDCMMYDELLREMTDGHVREAQFDEGSVWQFRPPSLNQAQQVPLTAMVHFQSRSYDRMMYDELLREMTEGHVREAQFDEGSVWQFGLPPLR